MTENPNRFAELLTQAIYQIKTQKKGLKTIEAIQDELGLELGRTGGSFINWHLGSYKEAEQQLEIGLSLGRKVSNPFLITIALAYWGLLADTVGDYNKARQKHEEGLAVYQSIQEQRGMGLQYILLGRVAYAQQEYNQAEMLLQEGLKICREIGDLIGVGVALSYLGVVNSATGEPEKGEQLCQESLVILRKGGNQFWCTLTLNHLGQITWTLGNYADARFYLLEALKLAVIHEPCGHWWEEPWGHR